MAVFVDTSALYALLSATDLYHAQARPIWDVLHDRRESLMVTNYIIVETTALVSRRLGVDALRGFFASFLPLLDVFWIDRSIHDQAIQTMLSIGDRDLSLVDCVSFAAMRALGIDTAFTFDAHFATQGFRRLPSS